MDSDVGATGVCPAPPPPPPPPVPGQVPALRISTTENSGSRPKPPPLNDPYEPPAAIQNAMLTKDKKPFTYTPGMGGKLDLSQIRSPRMARRVAKNANDEGIEGPPKSALEPKSVPNQAGANIYIQPQVAVPVFPASMPTQPLPNKTVVNNINRAPAPPPEKIIEPTKTVIRIEPRQVPPSSPSSPDSPTSPTQVMLAKAPTPWMKRTKSQEEDLPEWARRPNKSQESSPETATAPSVYVVQSASPPPPPQRNQPQNVVNHRPQQQRQMRPVSGEQNAPVRIEDRPSVFSVKNDPVGHHQFKNSSPQHQQRWGQPNAQQNQMPIQVQAKQRPQVQYRPQEQVQAQQQRQNPPSPRPQSQQGAYIVPMVVEGRAPSPTGTLIVQSSIPSQTRIIPIQPQSPQTSPQRNPMNQAEPGPIQSKSFRVLQKITSTDTPDEVDGDQLRKLQLTEDDRMLMNKFKEQVDSDNYLHQEEEPRFRGAAIPSRAFRYLQNMTDAGEITSNTLPRANNATPKKQNRNSRNFDEVQVNLPPSEQQVAEPKKYQGSAIPSRSFRILQAMTDPQSIGPDTTDY